MIKLGKFKKAPWSDGFEQAKHAPEYCQAEPKLHLPYLDAQCAQCAQEEPAGCKLKSPQFEKPRLRLRSGISSSVSDCLETERGAPYGRKGTATVCLHHARSASVKYLQKVAR